MSLLELLCAVGNFCKEMDEAQIGKLLGNGLSYNLRVYGEIGRLDRR